MPQGADKQLQHTVGVQGARPYRIVGNVPMDAVATTRTTHMSSDARPYHSDAPYVPPTIAYNDRPLCIGTRRNSTPCKAKARPEGSCCEAHLDQE